MTSFVDTRARSTDCDTSKAAAVNAVTEQANSHRTQIARCIRDYGPMTARQIANETHIDYHAVQRRLAEVGGICKTDEVRHGCRVWKAI